MAPKRLRGAPERLRGVLQHCGNGTWERCYNTVVTAPERGVTDTVVTAPERGATTAFESGVLQQSVVTVL